MRFALALQGHSTAGIRSKVAEGLVLSPPIEVVGIAEVLGCHPR